MSQPRCFVIRRDDNVATLLEDAPAGPLRVIGEATESEIIAPEPIRSGHKVALGDIPPGKAVIKYGVAIGRASQPISRGTWVHLHNCRSTFDERSHTLDPHTGATTDTRYE